MSQKYSKRGVINMHCLLRINVANKYNLYHRQKITYKELKIISENEGIDLEDLYRIFDISSGSKCKFRKKINAGCFITIYSQDEINEFKDEILNNMGNLHKQWIKQKYKLTDKAINEIERNAQNKSTLKFDIDMKYIYKEKFINKNYIEQLERLYKCNEDELIRNIAKSNRVYSAYKYALYNNKKGICILEDTRLSNSFFYENYKKIERYLEIKSNAKCCAYRCFDIKDDLKSEAYEQIIKVGGIYEKNLDNENKIINYLLNIAESKMNNFICKRPKFASLMYKVDGIEKEYEIPDNRYNPEFIL